MSRCCGQYSICKGCPIAAAKRAWLRKQADMSKKNITNKEVIDNNTVHVTFENEDGHRVYAYRGSSKRAIQRGKDPAGLTGGRLVSFTPRKK